ncbi:MAG: DNA repair protein RecO [Bacteroidales bacterium]|nr:DNA repair protein RecO [Bacteroidales bacterium]
MAKVTVKTRAIVLQSIKYGDSSLVVKMLTEEMGVQSFMVKGVYGKKSKMKAAFFQNMTLLEIVAEIGGSTLGFIKEISLSHYYKSISSDFKKTTILIFISELLSKSIAESEPDTTLFNYVYDSMIWLDEVESSYADFPIIFAMRLSFYLGFFPNIDTYTEGSCFDLLDGNFKTWSNDIYQIDAELSEAFYFMCQQSTVSRQQILSFPSPVLNFLSQRRKESRMMFLSSNVRLCSQPTALFQVFRFSDSQIQNNSQVFRFSDSQILKTRRQLLEAVATYYKLHSDNIREIKSLEVLREIMV